MLEQQGTGKRMTTAEAHEAIRRTFELKGRFILASPIQPELGEVQNYAGLPMRCTRYVTVEDAIQNHVDEIWGEWESDHEDFYFEVEVAD